MCCEVRVAASSGYLRNHSQTIIGWCSHNLCDYHNFESSGFLCPQRPCLPSITLACQDLPSDSLHHHQLSLAALSPSHFFILLRVCALFHQTHQSFPTRCFAPNLTASPAPHDMTVSYLVIVQPKDVPGHAWIGRVREGGVKMWCGDVTLLS